MPLKHGRLAGKISQPVLRGLAIVDDRLSPADFLNRVARDLAAERPASNWPPRQWPMTGMSAVTALRTDQVADCVDPRQRVVDTHRSAHEAESAEVLRACGTSAPASMATKLPWDAVRFEECGKITRTLGGSVSEDGDRFHEFLDATVEDAPLYGRRHVLPIGVACGCDWRCGSGRVLGQALLVIDGGAPTIVHVGQTTAEGVRRLRRG